MNLLMLALVAPSKGKRPDMCPRLGVGINVNQCWPMWANSNTVMARARVDKRIHIFNLC